MIDEAMRLLLEVSPVGRGVVLCPMCARGCFASGVVYHLAVVHRFRQWDRDDEWRKR